MCSALSTHVATLRPHEYVGLFARWNFARTRRSQLLSERTIETLCLPAYCRPYVCVLDYDNEIPSTGGLPIVPTLCGLSYHQASFVKSISICSMANHSLCTPDSMSRKFSTDSVRIVIGIILNIENVYIAFTQCAHIHT